MKKSVGITEQAVNVTLMDGTESLSDEKHVAVDLSEGEVHVWWVSIDRFLFQTDRFLKKLSIDEKERADRCHLKEDKKRYIICRGILRSIISFYLEIEAGEAQFSYGKYGKPAITSDGGPEKLQFNMAHSNCIAIYAFVCGRRIGIDVEHVRDIPEMNQIVESLFSDKEKKVFYALPENLKKTFFFQIWTRKEAMLKGLGNGFQQIPDKVDVLSETVLLPEPVAGNLSKFAQWQIRNLSFSPAYTAAFAIEETSRFKIQPYNLL